MPYAAKRIRRPKQPARRINAGIEWYRTQQWKRLRSDHLGEHPYCVHCQAEGKPLGQCTGNVVDHMKAHRGNRALFFDPSNLRTLCASHHSRKTASQDGGFGNRVRSAN